MALLMALVSVTEDTFKRLGFRVDEMASSAIFPQSWG